jgi:hypothetical protein
MSVIPNAPPRKPSWLTAATDAMVSDKVVTGKNQWCSRSVSAAYSTPAAKPAATATGIDRTGERPPCVLSQPET